MLSDTEMLDLIPTKQPGWSDADLAARYAIAVEQMATKKALEIIEDDSLSDSCQSVNEYQAALKAKFLGRSIVIYFNAAEFGSEALLAKLKELVDSEDFVLFPSQ